MSGAMMMLAGANSSGSSPATQYITPSEVSAIRAGVGSATTGTATMQSASTYLWEKDSGDDFTINSPSAQATSFTTTLGNGAVKRGVYRCTTTTPAAVGYVNVTAASTSTV